MNYEALLETASSQSKSVKDLSASVTRLQKALQKNLDAGNLPEVKKGLNSLLEAVAQLKSSAEALSEAVNGFDVQTYFIDGEFTRQLLEACAQKGIDVKGEKGIYEMFPYKLRVLGDQEHPAEVWLDRKKVQSCRPAYVAETVRAGQAKLYAASFKLDVFMNELADAYETTCLKAGARLGSTQSLTKIYRCLAPTARARRDYDMQAYAFDLARLYEAGTEAWMSRGGVRYDFGTSRNGQTGIRVLSSTGVETYVSTLRPLKDGEA